MPNMKSTSRKAKIVGMRTFIDSFTGEEKVFYEEEILDRDFNFIKFWAQTWMMAIDDLGSAVMKIIMCLLENASKNNNFVIMTVRELVKSSGTSTATVVKVLNILEENKLIKRRPGVIFVNPNAMWKGSHSKRISVLIHFTKWEGEQLDAFEELKKSELKKSDDKAA